MLKAGALPPGLSSPPARSLAGFTLEQEVNHFPFYPRPGLHMETGGKAFSSSAQGFA